MCFHYYSWTNLNCLIVPGFLRQGGFWDVGAISNARWTGVRLRDVLVAAGLDPNNTSALSHVQVSERILNYPQSGI